MAPKERDEKARAQRSDALGVTGIESPKPWKGAIPRTWG